MLITGGCCHDYAKQKEILKAGIEARTYADDFRRHDFEDRIYRLNESSKTFPKIIQFISAILFILYPNDMVVKKQFEEMQEYIRSN